MKTRTEAAQRDREARGKFLVPRWDSEKWIETICLTCNDLGWVVWHGKESDSCPDCDGRKFDRTTNMLKHSGIPSVTRSQRFASFRLLEGTAESLKATKILTSDPELDSQEVFMVMIYGRTGSGKTYLAHASGLEAIAKGFPVRFVRCGELLRELKAVKSQDNGQVKYDELFKMYSEIHYLIIDDLDWGTDADIRMIDDLICTREANHLMMLITTNRSLIDIEEALPRVLSRFKDKRFARLVYNRAGDYRKRGAK